MEQNSNINAFAQELSNIIDQPIGLAHIHAMSEGRFYYTQAPEVGAPMLLHHYRGPFFVDIHPDDLKKILSGEISVHSYIYSANWQVGYYWGGNSMISGGYYQPMDIIGNQTEVRRYLKILVCRGYYRSCGYMPTEEKCAKCSVENCPFSEYKEGTLDSEIEEYDPRIDFFEALCRRFESQFPGYTFRGFLCSNISADTIVLTPNGHYAEEEPYSFVAYASKNVIRDLMMYKNAPVDWDEYAKSFKFQLHRLFSQDYLDVNDENIRKIFTDFDYVAKEKQHDTELEISELLENEENLGIIAKIFNFFKQIF